jgi:predicted TIM-barrel fold metal-dependent hydrolase
VAQAEGRDAAYVAACLAIPERGPLPDALAAILDLVAAHDIALNTGHLSAAETVRLVELAQARGVTRLLCPANYFTPDDARALTALGACVEFSFFFVTHATQVGLTHVDAEKHRVDPVTLPRMIELIAAVPPEQVVLSGDCGVSVLPPPVEGLREFLWSLKLSGVPETTLRRAVGDNPARLFRLAAPA